MKLFYGLARKLLRARTHGEQIEQLLQKLEDASVIVETGCGLSTLTLDGQADTVISCDYNQAKIDALKPRCPTVRFIAGDSIENLTNIAAEHERIDFLFLDSAASAMHTFREFMAVEKSLRPGSILLIDNAAIPGARGPLLSPARKGKILVPYLLASSYWEVTSHPRSGDSMVAAIYRAEPDYADARYEDRGYIDNWQSSTPELLSHTLARPR